MTRLCGPAGDPALNAVTPLAWSQGQEGRFSLRSVVRTATCVELRPRQAQQSYCSSLLPCVGVFLAHLAQGVGCRGLRGKTLPRVIQP